MAELKKVNLCDRADFNSLIVDCLGCKWTIILMENIDRGINRPGQLVRVIEGLTTKVLNQCLNRMINYGIVEKKSFTELPLKVEYYLTPFGSDLNQILIEIKSLQAKYCNM